MPTHGLGLAIIRVIVGGWFFKAVVTKLTIEYIWWIPFPTVSQRFLNFLPKRLAEFASDNPVGWYHQFLVETAIPHAKLFAFLETFGEVGVGVGLILGLVTSFSSLIGLLMSINFVLASQWMGFCQQGFNTVLAGCMLGCLLGRAGRTWGIDAWLANRSTNAVVRRLL
ncbi:MAG: DoxX family membrane protein [Nitrospinae bacterium]|nr:DoxX family membrane protein [Nitrospinota bacterium]